MATRKRASSRSAAHLLVGADAYLREERREEIIRENVPEEARDFAVARFSLARTRLGEILAQAETRPMLGERQVLVVADADSLREEDLRLLEKYLQAPAEFSVLVFEAEELDRRTRAAKFLEKHCQKFEAASTDSRGVEQALEFARGAGVELDAATAGMLVMVLGNDLARLRSEVAKLRAYAGPGGRVGSKDVEELVVPARKFGVFDLVEPLADRRREVALQLVRRLLEGGESPMGMVGVLAWLYRQLLVAHALGPEAPFGKARQVLSGPPDRVNQLLRQAQRFSPDDLRAAFAALHEADVALKSSPPDHRAGIAGKHATLILEVLVAKLAGARAAAAAR